MKEKLTNNLLFKILSVIFAIVIWLVVINIDDPVKTVTIRGVNVEILNEEQIVGKEQVYTVQTGRSCIITVTGPRSIVDSLSPEDFVATADFAEISQTNAIPINVALSQSSLKYENKLNIVQKTNTMILAIEKVISKEYEIEAVIEGELDNKYMLGEPKLSQKTVVVKAAESIIASIENVKAIVKVSKDTTSGINQKTVLTYVNASGGVLEYDSKEMNTSIKEVELSAEMYVIKEIPVRYTITQDTFDDYKITESNVDKKNIKVYGLKADIDKLKEIQIPAELVDVENSQDTEFVIDIEKLLPTGIKPYKGFEQVKITIVKTNIISNTYNIDLNDVMIKKIPDGYEASIVDSGTVKVTLIGLETLFANVDPDNFLPYVDLTSAKEGDNNVELIITLPDGVNQKARVTVKVSVTTKESEEIIDNNLENTEENIRNIEDPQDHN